MGDSVESGVKLGEKKRPAEDGDDPVAKRVKKNGGGVMGRMRKVAEMVLVLSAMGKMRGGKVPTGVEKEIMAAAREKLAEVCELFPPKDVFPTDVFGGIIEYLGLNKVREQRLGFRPPKVTIAEKFLLSKRKMEKAEEFTLPSAQNSQRLHPNSGVAVEYRATSPAGRVFATDKPGHAPISSGTFQTSPLGHVTGTNISSLPYQLPTSEVRPMAPNALPFSHLGRDSTPVTLARIDRPHFGLDGRPNGSSHTSQVQANSSGDLPSVKTPAWPVQPQFVPPPKFGAEKGPAQATVKVDGATDAKFRISPQIATSKPFVTQTISGNQLGVHQHLQGASTVPASLPRNTHAEIGKIVQKLLQPWVSERPVWTTPSRDYMNKALTCQTCKSTINDVDSLLVCDACEKGYHLKCLRINSPKGVPRAEWHCLKCLQLSNGKPLPPKYGRVMRNISVPKVASNAAALQSTPDKRAGALDEKVNQQKIIANGNATVQSAPTGNTLSNHSNPTPSSKVENKSEVQGDAIGGKEKMDDKSSSRISLNDLIEASCPATVSPPTLSSVKRMCEEKLLESKPHPHLKSETVLSFSAPLQSPTSREDNHRSGPPNNVIPFQQSLDNHPMVKCPQESSGRESLCNNMTEKSSQKDEGTVRAIPPETSAANSGPTDQERSVPDSLHSVDWIGGILKVVEGKVFYQSCCIKGVVYKLKDNVLIRFNDRLIPSKLQVMWEDMKMKTKWVTVNKCYFPDDLPQAVGRPCGLESSEVYESTIACTVMAGLIHGPCEVLPPSRFTEEKEKRTRVGKRPNESLQPLYLCKWIYDEPKGLFRDVNC
ncbi:hypothetical protein ACH5RR_027837 [Cinchona calisaya]|uniref:PHD finger protein n=1 Tax=Cinchona calisaya TaxID=153742 RepID=A0ABD2YP62_9GENT